MSRDHVVLGGSPPAPPPAPTRPNRPAALLVLAAVAIAAVVFRAPDPVEPPTQALDAPVEPPAGGALARDWRVVELGGSGSRVSAVSSGPAGWLAVAVEGGMSLHRSEDGVAWETFDLPGLDGTDPTAVVGASSMGAAFAPDDGSGIVAAVSIDRGASWSLDAITSEPAWLGGLVEIDGHLHAFGSVGSESGFQWRDEGQAAVWVHDGLWRHVDVDGGVGSVVTAALPVDGEVVLFGHTQVGPTAWRLSDGAFRPVVLTVPAGGESRSIIEVVFDGERHVALVGDKGLSNGGRTLWESIDLMTWTVLDDKVFKLVTLDSDGAGTLLGRLGESGGIWVSTGDSEAQTYTFQTSDGSVVSPYLTALAVDDGTLVAGTGTGTGAAVLVRQG